MVSDDIPTEEFDTTWTNYGDVNPKKHGGRFVRWDSSGVWVVVVTWDGSIRRYEFEPQAVWVDGEPEKGFTSAMDRILTALHENGGKRGPSPGPTSKRFMENAAYYVADLPHQGRFNHSRGRVREDETYEEALERYGVDSWE